MWSWLWTALWKLIPGYNWTMPEILPWNLQCNLSILYLQQKGPYLFIVCYKSCWFCWKLWYCGWNSGYQSLRLLWTYGSMCCKLNSLKIFKMDIMNTIEYNFSYSLKDTARTVETYFMLLKTSPNWKNAGPNVIRMLPVNTLHIIRRKTTANCIWILIMIATWSEVLQSRIIRR